MNAITNNKKMHVFEFIDKEEYYQELEVEDTFPLHNLLNSEAILAFSDPITLIIWVWIGKNCSVKMRFAASYLSSSLKMKFNLIGYKIKSVDEGTESKAFRLFLGLEEEVQQIEHNVGPRYTGTIEDEKELELYKIEEILQILTKVDVPEGYSRKMVIIGDIIYLYIEKLKYYFGTNIRERCLVPFKKKIDDGPYLMELYIPRLIVSFNKVLLIELLQKVGFKK